MVNYFVCFAVALTIVASSAIPIEQPPYETISKQHFEVENASKLGKYESNEFMARGIRWKVRVEKTDNNNMGVFLQANEKDMAKNKIAEVPVKGVFKLFPSGSFTNEYSKTFGGQFGKGKTVAGDSKFIKIGTLPGNKFTKDDVAKFRVEFNIGEPKREK